ncbi:zincin-like metallopeptidase domain-containing protein [Tardibacter chloracetimidivorans]|uniref:zincin-like metallopeptidase domain-containing protein n=1 Tax=Tardibacter chloracetimidivorans TaxID=1921510 RepID=UPI001D03BD94|nr:zincin-like metallopeptidase domain-containing protein [Tardibacter chloracetimidivorans]
MAKYPVPVVEIKNRDERDPDLDAAFARYPVPYSEGGSSAFYRQSEDRIQMPAFGDFVSGNAFYATLAHEGIHSTGHPDRLDRDSLRDYGKSKEIRAFEELIALSGQSAPSATLQ